MKDITATVISLLKLDPAIALKTNRVYRGDDIPTNPSPQKPFIAVQLITDPPEPPTSSCTYSTARIQCITFETTGAKAAELSGLIGEALSWERIANTVVNGIEISDVDDQGPNPDNSDAKTTKEFRDIRDFMITYRLR